MKKPKKPKSNTVRVNGQDLPRLCECGGEMKYSVDFGRVFSYCKSCTPVQTVTISRGGVK